MSETKHLLVSSHPEKTQSFKDKLFTHTGISYLGLALVSKPSKDISITITMYDDDRVRFFAEKVIDTMITNVTINAKIHTYCLDGTYLPEIGGIKLAPVPSARDSAFYAQHMASLDIIHDSAAHKYTILCNCVGEFAPRTLTIQYVEEVDEEEDDV